MPPTNDERPAPSEAELQLLKLLWRLGPATVREVHDAVLRDGSDWAYTTVQTMLLRMVEKGHVTVNRDGFAHVFTAAVSRARLLGLRLDELKDKLCDGAVAPLLQHLATGGSFTAEEIAQLRRLLDEAERQREDT